MMRRVLLLLLNVIAAAVALSAQQPPTVRPAWSADLSDIRRVAALIPGRKPLRINFLKFPESHPTKNFSVKGEPPQPSRQARTVFQAVYPHGYLRGDAGSV